MSLVAFRNLAEPGGPRLLRGGRSRRSPASTPVIKDGPNDGRDVRAAGRLADRFPKPVPNEQAARAANGGAYPPTCRLMAKARTYERGFPWFVLDIFTQYQEAGPDYIVRAPDRLRGAAGRRRRCRRACTTTHFLAGNI
jgi:cytochrome c1